MAMSTTQANEQTITEEETNIGVPGNYRVILHNDDRTTFEFVIYILKNIFDKSDNDALSITKYIHTAGSSTVGIYTHQIAETKVEEVHELANVNGFPLKATFEEV